MEGDIEILEDCALIQAVEERDYGYGGLVQGKDSCETWAERVSSG